LILVFQLDGILLTPCLGLYEYIFATMYREQREEKEKNAVLKILNTYIHTYETISDPTLCNRIKTFIHC